MFSTDEKYLKRALQIASRSALFARPNPSVGAVLVVGNRIIGEGVTGFYGGAHAEVNAFDAVPKIDEKYLPKATLYVTLEPCSHYGKTPPCVQTIIRKKIQRVVIGCLDPHQKVNGRGIHLLGEAGIRVTVGILQKQCEYHHRHFIIQQKKQRPFITLKWAKSADGFLAPKIQETQTPHWITGAYSRQQVHCLRTQHMAILIGKNTALKDNPRLDVRLTGGDSPLRLILDPSLHLPKNLHLFIDGQPTVVFFQAGKTAPKNTDTITYQPIEFNNHFPLPLLEWLHQKGVQSLLVEGGSVTLNAFIVSDLWDEAFVFKGASPLKEGIKAPFLKHLLPLKKQIFQKDTLYIYFNP